MRTGWTGGQYSLWRAALGLVLLALVARAWIDTVRWNEDSASPTHVACDWIAGEASIPCPSPRVALLAASACALMLAVGFRDRIAALLLAAALAAIEFAVPLASTRALPNLLVLHACMPPRPFLAWDARGRADPAGGWSVSPSRALLVRVAWALLVAVPALRHLPLQLESGPETYALWASQSAEHGVLLLRALGPAAASFLHGGHLALTCVTLLLLPLACMRRAWAAFWWILALDLAFYALVRFPNELDPLGLSVRLLVLGYFFDPAWVPARGGDAVERIYYDGECGLCQRAVRFVLAEDPDGRRFRFAPLQGERFARDFEPALRARLPDSIVVHTADGRVLVRSDAVVHLLQRLGGVWRVLGTLLALVPRPLRDLAYDAIARVRTRLFAAPKVLCPLGPKHVTDRFDD